MKKPLLILAVLAGLFFAAQLRGSAVNVYIAQTVAGAGDGSSCANAWPVAYFNSASNWGSGATQIGAGTIVHLCGGITSGLTFQGSGAAGNPIVLDGTGASFVGSMTLTNRQYWTIQNVTWFVGSAGGITVSNGAFGLITGNRMDMGGGAIFLGQNDNGMAHDIVISNNFLRNSASSSAGDLIATEGSYNIIIEGNYFENRGTNDNSHVDIIQTWQRNSGGSGPPRDITIRHNMFVMDTPSQSNKSFHMLENLTGSVKIYGNVYAGLRGGSGGSGINMNNNLSGMQAEIYGNTVVQKAGGTNNLFNLKGNGQWILRNNVTYGTDAGNTLLGNAVGTSRMTRSNNLWFGSGSPSCVATEICGSDPLFADFAGNDFSLQDGSPGLGSGMNLGAAYATSPVRGAQWPNPTLGSKPVSGGWDMGAFVGNGGPPPPPPAPIPLAIATASLPPATVGSPYGSGPLQAVGGTGPYFWTATDLPGWASLAGNVISGQSPVQGLSAVTLTVTDSAATPASASVTLSLVAAQPPPFTSSRIRAGGAAVTDSQGRLWDGDRNFSAGSTACSNNTISNTLDPVLYQCERYGAFTYTFTVPAGSYQVMLKFAETHFTGGAASGQRRFNVAINGTTVLTDFDIKAAAGGANRAVDRTFTVNMDAANSNLQIQFIHLAGQPDLPKVDAIEIVITGPPVITTHPANRTVIEGQPATFMAAAGGSGPISYQWRRGGVDIPGATASSYTTPATVMGDNGATFDVMVSNAGGGTTSNTATLIVNPLAVTAVSMNPASVTGGTPSTGTVTLNGPAPAGGAVVTLASSNTSAATVPDSVTVAANATSAPFAVTTTPGSAQETAEITATLNGLLTTTLTVNAPAILAVSLDPTAVIGGTPSEGTITLNGPAPAGGAAVFLSSSNAAVATVVTGVSVAAGATTTTFEVTTLAVAAQASASITAILNGSASATLTVEPEAAPPTVATGPANQTVFEGRTATFSVVATGTSPFVYKWRKNGVDIPGATAPSYTTPATVMGDNGATFDVIVSNAGGGTTSNTATLTVNPLAVTAVSINPASVTSGTPSTGTVTLNGPAPAGGAVVTLASSNTSVATVPGNVTVAANASTATFTVNTLAVAGVSPITITATRNGSANGILTVNPPSNFNPIRVNSGGSAFTAQGRTWSADTSFSGGSAASVSSSRAIGNTVDDALYRNERYGAFTYTFTVPAGSYQVTLKFSETHFTSGAASGQRRFNVAINGTTVLTNFDIKSAAGGANIAVDRTFTVNAGAGSNNLQIQFIHLASQPDLPKVDAIEIVRP